MDLFQRATLQKFRFSTSRGLITTEDLWDLSLTELDQTAIKINRTIKATSEESFLNTSTSDETLAAHLEVVKAVISYKEKQEELRKQEAVRRARQERLLELIEQKERDKEADLSIEELKEQLAQLQS